MRILTAHPGPNFSVADVYTGWTEGLRANGCQVAEFNLDARLAFYEQACYEQGDGSFTRMLTHEQAVELAGNGLLAALYKLAPDVLFVVSAFFIDPAILDLARARGTRVVVLHTESPYEDDRQVQVAGHADLNLVNDPTNLGRFREVGRAVYLPHAYRPAVHHPGPPEPDLACDLVMVGTGYRSRIGFLEACGLDGVDVALAGNWQALDEHSPLRALLAHDIEDCCDNVDAARLYRSARAGLNLYRREAERPELAAGWAMGPREVEMAACGLFFLRDPRPESDVTLPMLPTFTGPQDFCEQLAWWLARESQRRRAADAAMQAIAERTFTNHAAHLLRLLSP